MNEQKQKIYVDEIWIDEKTFDDGGSFLKLGIKVDEFIVFLQKHKNEKGRVNLIVSKKRSQVEEGKSTHYSYLDTWQPKGQSPAPAQTTKTVKAIAKPVKSAPPVDDDEPMF